MNGIITRTTKENDKLNLNYKTAILYNPYLCELVYNGKCPNLNCQHAVIHNNMNFFIPFQLKDENTGEDLSYLKNHIQIFMMSDEPRLCAANHLCPYANIVTRCHPVWWYQMSEEEHKESDEIGEIIKELCITPDMDYIEVKTLIDNYRERERW